MMNTPIPIEDLYLVQELAKTLTVIEIAEKWESNKHIVSAFLKRHGKSASQIKLDYRIEFIKSHTHWGVYDFALEFDISPQSVWRIQGMLL